MTEVEAQGALHPFISGRRSPRNYLDRPVNRTTLLTLLEAARRAASSSNRQPWNFIVASRADAAAHERLFSCLLPGNQSWAGGAPVLMLVVAAVEHDGRPARTSFYDTGLAMGNLTVQAMALGLMLRQMAGIDRDHARAKSSPFRQRTSRSAPWRWDGPRRPHRCPKSVACSSRNPNSANL